MIVLITSPVLISAAKSVVKNIASLGEVDSE